MRHVMAQKSDEVRTDATENKYSSAIQAVNLADKIKAFLKQEKECEWTTFHSHSFILTIAMFHFLTSSMRHPKQKSHLDGSKSDLIARCFSVRKSVFVK